MVAIPEQGRLEEVPLPRLLMNLHDARFHGALSLTRERVQKRFLFQSGSPVFAESNLASESLGVQLMDAGQLDRANYNRVIGHIERRGCQEGAALLELGLLQPRDLFEALKHQVRIRLVECFGWPLGGFEVDPDSPPPDDAAPFRADLYAVLQAGIETHWPSDRVLMDLAPRMQEFPQPTKRFESVAERLVRDSAVDALLEALDGSRSLWQLVQLANSPRAQAAAWVLDAAGVFDYTSAPDGEAAEDEGVELPLQQAVEIIVDDTTFTVEQTRPRSSSKRPRRIKRDGRSAALHQQILDRYEELRGLNAYELLGVARNVDAGSIKRAYLQAAKSYHPDTLARMGLEEDVHEKANKIFAEISKAHAILADPGRRKDYDAALAMDATDLDAERLARAEMNFRKGEILMRQGNHRGAIDFLRPAVELWPDECAYQSALGWALFKKQPPEPEPARKHLEEAARLDPDDGETLLRLSQVLRALGENEAAQAAFDRAHQVGSALSD